MLRTPTQTLSSGATDLEGRVMGCAACLQTLPDPAVDGQDGVAKSLGLFRWSLDLRCLQVVRACACTCVCGVRVRSV